MQLIKLCPQTLLLGGLRKITEDNSIPRKFEIWSNQIFGFVKADLLLIKYKVSET
jgi:hypothetical protein